jgi:hypothetical protein
MTTALCGRWMAASGRRWSRRKRTAKKPPVDQWPNDNVNNSQFIDLTDEEEEYENAA